MRQLTGMDASFLFMEDSRMTGHVGGVLIVDPSTADRPINADTIRAYIADRIPVLPPLRWTLVEVPTGIDLPYWYDDHDVDLDYHVRGIALPAPGTPAQLMAQVERIHARPLDRAHPLWEIYVIEGLEDGTVAIYTKLHHAAVDGKSGMQILSTVLSPDPHASPPPRPATMPPSEQRPSSMEMLAKGWKGVLAHPGRSVELVGKVAREWQKTVRGFGLPSVSDIASVAKQPLPKPAPRLSFNKSVTARRNWAYGSVPLESVKKIKNAQDCTINDVVMALVAGGMRRWLQAHDELPADPIRAMVPVSIRSDEQVGDAGNQVSAMIADLPTNLDDPLARLVAMRGAMTAAKKQHAMLPAALLLDFGRFAAPAAAELVARTAASFKVLEKVSLPFNLVVSNVPGPRVPLYYAGALLKANYPVSVITDGMALNITVQSYLDSLDFGLLSCPEIIPDLGSIMDYMHEELAELEAIQPSK